MSRLSLHVSCALALALALVMTPVAFGQTIIGYGVNSAGTLFSFDVATPATVTTHGVVGAVTFVPEGIDFRPGTNQLYAIDVGPNTTSLYTLNITTGVPTLVGSFNSAGMDYSLTGTQTFGFDFNPKTVQLGDNSMRIRLVATNNANLRINSNTGQIAEVDTNLAFANQSSPFVDAAAYINNTPSTSGATTLFVMDSRNDAMLRLLSPNNGQVEDVGAFGFMINAQRNIGFDIYTTPGTADDLSGDVGYAVYQRPDAPDNGPLGAYLIYNVNLATGATTGGALVGPAMTPFDFDGGFALLPAVPEPTGLILAAVACAGVVRRRSRR
jgi:hypothetical protein